MAQPAPNSSAPVAIPNAITNVDADGSSKGVGHEKGNRGPVGPRQDPAPSFVVRKVGR